MTGSGSGSGDCADVVNFPEDPRFIFVGPPFDGRQEIPYGLRVLMAVLDGSETTLQVCGDQGIGAGATLTGGTCETVRALDPGPIPDGLFPASPPEYPGIGVTAYACQLNCDYSIVGTLGANVIVGLIDDQWHILRVLASASTLPLFGPSDDCRCCGANFSHSTLQATILSVSPEGCGPYRACQKFILDAGANSALHHNPMGLGLLCTATPTSKFEDLKDWRAEAFGASAEVVEIHCCGQAIDCAEHSVSIGGAEVCKCTEGGDIFGSGSGSGSGACEFTGLIRFSHDGCDYEVLITKLPQDPCVKFDDEPIEIVTMEACGLPNLKAGDRVIMAKIPIDPGSGSGSGSGSGDLVEWFVVRACSSLDCADPCDAQPPVGPLCCGKHCSQMPNTLTATIEIVSSDCQCTTGGNSLVMTLNKWGGNPSACGQAIITQWYFAEPDPVADPVVDFCKGTVASPQPPYPTKISISNLTLVCGQGDELCANGGSGSGSGGIGPSFTLTVDYPSVYTSPTGNVHIAATQDRSVSCCSPLFLQYEVTGDFCMALLPGVVSPTTTLKITITE